MEIEAFIKKKKYINSALIDYIEVTDDHIDEFEALKEVLEKQNILENEDEIRLLFQLISKISDNHYRTSDFFDKLEKIFQYLIKDIPSPITYFIPDYTSYNKRMLFLLLEKGFVKPDETFLNQYLQSKTNNDQFYYLYPKIKKFLDQKLQKQIEEEISQKYSETISTFEEKCQIGENDSYICSLIRSDSVEKFIAYTNQNNLSLLTKIKPSIYETHSFLIDKEPTLIEYASFFGSIQIIQYLKYNNVPLTPSLWLYTIHSNNAELIHFLEENEVKPESELTSFFWFNPARNKKPFDNVLIESIRCHHNAISNYITDNYYEQIQAGDQNHFYDNFRNTIVNSLNFYFFPNEIESIICKQENTNGFKLSQLCFSECSSLIQITIPSSVTFIGYSAFEGCSSLKQITIPSSVTSIGYFAFNGCSSLTQITIPSSVTSIGNYAFNGCSSLAQITIPSSITSIGGSAFNGCSSLTQITIPYSVTSIGNNAFKGCSSLAQIEIPSSVTSFGENIFNGIKRLEIKGDIQCIPKALFLKCSELTHITIPSSVTSIGNSAFKESSSLEQITIPSSVTSIEDDAFSGCSSLTQITIPSSVTSIGNYAFSYCSSLAQITIPSSVTSFGKNIFNGVKCLEIKGDIQCIPKELFLQCSELEQTTIPSSVTSIGDSSFYSCKSLTQITIPSSVTSIKNYAFYSCKSLTQIAIPSSVTSIGISAFSYCSSLEQIKIPSSVTSIKSYTFHSCKSLAQMAIPSSVTSIGNSAFNGCSSLKQITIPPSVASIGDSAFYSCTSLTQITIPSSVTSIGNSSFEKCSSLTQITFEIPSSLISIGDYAFYGCLLLSAESIELINSIKSNIINNSKDIAATMSNKSNINPNLKQNINTFNNHNTSMMANNKPHNDYWSNFGENSSNKPYTWNNNIANKISLSFGTNIDEKSSWRTRSNNFKLEDQKSMNEIEIIKMLDHPNVLKKVDIIYDDKKTPIILFEECPTNLNQVIQNKFFSKVQLVYSIYQIAEGMKYIHSRKIVHLNLKPTNILISKDGTIKISDFKNAEKITSDNEIKENDDIYSFGEIVYFILSGHEINDSEKEAVLKSFSLLARQLIEACFYDDFKCRPTFEMICSILEQYNFNLISLTQQEIEDVSKLISGYRQNSIY